MGVLKRLKVAVALGGGAARGMAHIGVLRVLERERIPIDIIVGTSIGAILGGAYAATQDSGVLEQRVREVLQSEEFKKNKLNFLRETKQQRGGLFFSVANLVRRGIFYGVSTLRPSFLSAEEFAGSMAAVIPDRNIEDLPIKFGAVALDIESGREVVLCTGGLRQAAAASSAIPGILPPVRRNGRLLIDGGWVDKVPVMAAFKLGADVVIAVDISAGIEQTRSYQRGVDVMVRANAIKDWTLVNFLRQMADVLIRPEVRSVHWADFGAFETCIAEGDRAAEGQLGGIRRLVRRERLFTMVRQGPRKRMAQHLLDGENYDICID